MNVNDNNNFSIIVPTFREAKNVPELVKRISKIDFGQRSFEVILIDDDSRDGVEEVVNTLRNQYPWLKLIIRQDKRSLSASVVLGFYHAQYPVLIVMDADLSHPPERIKDMLNLLKDPSVDFVIGSRYIQGGSADDIWPVTRKMTSRVSAFIARVLISLHVHDPLSGFFAVRKVTLISGDTLKPIGWKIGLEVMIKCRCKKIIEIPIHFSQRLYGKSKLNVKVACDYLIHVYQLVVYKIL